MLRFTNNILSILIWLATLWHTETHTRTIISVPGMPGMPGQSVIAFAGAVGFALHTISYARSVCL